MAGERTVTPDDLIDVYPPDASPDGTHAIYVGLCWERLGLTLGNQAAGLFGAFRVHTERPEFINKEKAAKEHADFKQLVGFAPEDVLAALYAAEHLYGVPPSYMKPCVAIYSTVHTGWRGYCMLADRMRDRYMS